MPIYEYRCGACSHELEALQKMNDAKLTDCPECGESALKRLMSAPSFRLKGSGWYETDFKTDKDKKRNLVDGSDKSSAASDKPDKPVKSDAKSSDKPKSESKSSKPSGAESAGGNKPSSPKGSGSEAA